MIVCRVRPDLSFEVIDREKDMIRLGTGGLDGRRLTETTSPPPCRPYQNSCGSPRRTASTKSSPRRRAPSARPTTAPISSATVKRELGLHVRVISGTEEARLIHLAAAYAIDVGKRAGGRHRHRRRQHGDHGRHRRADADGPQLQARRHPADRALRQERSAAAARRAAARAPHPPRDGALPRHSSRKRAHRPRHRHVGHDPLARRARRRRAGRPTTSATSASRAKALRRAARAADGHDARASG